jgi:CheY-like chemotaxis protein
MTKKIRTCLLVTDDPDDQLEFSEALNGIAKDAVLIAVADSKKALSLIENKLLMPSFIFLDISMVRIKPNEFINRVTKLKLRNTTLVVYGKKKKVGNIRLTKGEIFLDSGYTYPELQQFLYRLLTR